MSTETPDAHDSERLPEGERAVGSDRRPGTDEELTVVVCPQRVYEQLRPELGEQHERRYGDYEREYEDLLVERSRLADEVNRLERRLESKKCQLDAVVARNERVLEARTESYRERIEDGDDDFVWTGRRQESGLVARLRNWLR